MESFAPAQVALVVTFVSLVGAFLEMVRESRASKARRGRDRFLRPNQSGAYAPRGLRQWQYEVVSADEDGF